MTLSGTGINQNVVVLDQLSSSGSETGVAGTYKISYNANTAVQTITANDSVTNNTNLYVTSVSSGTILPGQIFKLGSQYFNIDSVVSSGVYGISSTGTIASIYPQTITTSLFVFKQHCCKRSHPRRILHSRSFKLLFTKHHDCQ